MACAALNGNFGGVCPILNRAKSYQESKLPADGLRTSAGISADKPCPNGVLHSVIKKGTLKRTGACLNLGGKRSKI